jgi:hypothetical protein
MWLTRPNDVGRRTLRPGRARCALSEPSTSACEDQEERRRSGDRNQARFTPLDRRRGSRAQPWSVRRTPPAGFLSINSRRGLPIVLRRISPPTPGIEELQRGLRTIKDQSGGRSWQGPLENLHGVSVVVAWRSGIKKKERWPRDTGEGFPPGTGGTTRGGRRRRPTDREPSRPVFM